MGTVWKCSWSCYHEAEYSLSLLLLLHNILKDKRITKDKDISDLIELANDGLPNLRARFEMLLNQITTLEDEKSALGTEILGLRNSIYSNNEIIRKQNVQVRVLDRRLNQLQVMLRKVNKDPDLAQRARSAGWDYHELKTGHDAMITVPDKLVQILGKRSTK